MKRITFLSSLVLFANVVLAQSDTTHIDITLKSKYHAYIISLMSGRADIDKIRYPLQVAEQLTLPIDTAQLITVNVTVGLIKSLYNEIGEQPERYTTNYNEEIKIALIPQIMGYPDLLNALMTIAAQNAAKTEQIVASGFEYLQVLKL